MSSCAWFQRRVKMVIYKSVYLQFYSLKVHLKLTNIFTLVYTGTTLVILQFIITLKKTLTPCNLLSRAAQGCVIIGWNWPGNRFDNVIYTHSYTCTHMVSSYLHNTVHGEQESAPLNGFANVYKKALQKN